MVVCLAVMPALQSCDDNDGYSIGDFTGQRIFLVGNLSFKRIA